MKEKSAAIVTINNAPKMSKRGRNNVADWLERQAKFLRQNANQLSSRFRARYIYTLMLCAPLLVTGCGILKVKDTAGSPYVTPEYVEGKAHAIAIIVGTEALKNNPGGRVQLELARADIAEILSHEEVTASDVANIVAKIPKVAGSKNGMWISAGALVLQDDLNRISVSNPELFRAALVGAEKGAGEILSQ